MFIRVLSFLLPLYNLRFNIGIEVVLVKVMPLLLLPFIFFRSGLHLKRRLKRVSFLAFALLLYMLLVTMWRYQISLDAAALSRSVKTITQDPSIYMATQYLFWFFPILMIFILQAFRFDQKKSSSYFNYFSYGLLFSSVFGICLLASYNLLGIGIIDSFEVMLNRLGGLSGEPRHLGSFIVLVLIFCSVRWSNNLNIINAGSRLQLFLIGALMLTISSSAIGGYLIFILLSLFNRLLGLRLNKKAVLISVISFPFIFVLILYTDFAANMALRFSSFESLLYYLPKDFGIVWFLFSDFDYLLFGCGAGGVDTFLASQLWILPDSILRAPIFAETGIDVTHVAASGGLIRFLSDFGLVGMALLSYFVFSVINLSPIKQQSKTNLKLAFFCFPVLSTMSFVVFLYGIFVLSCTASEDKSYLSSESKPKLGVI